MPQQEQGLYEFEGFVLDPVRRLLARNGEPVPLPPKALATLLVLVERHGQVVEKEELFQTIWPDTFITEATLTQNIFRLRKSLGEEAGEHRFIVTVPGRGYSFVADLRRLEPAPAPAPSPENEPPPAVTPSEPLPPPKPAADRLPSPRLSSAARARRRWTLFGGSTLGLIGLAATLLFVLPPFRRADPPPSPAAAQAAVPVPRRSVAVLGFRNLSGRRETAWLSTALAEMFTSELGVGEKLHTITGESVTQTKRDLGLNDPENLSTDTLTRLRGLLGCDVVLLGSYLALGTEGGGRIRVDLRLQDTASGETLSVLTATRTETELFEMVSDLGKGLREKLGTGGPPSRTEVASTRAAFPVSAEAARLYSEGLEHLRSLDTLKARDLLEQATRAEPGFPLSHAALAIAWSTLGYDANAVDEAAKALELAATLPREDRLLVEALHAETRKEWSKAVDIYDSLWRFFPDDLEHGLRLAQAEIAAGHPKRALDTIATLRRLPPPSEADPRIDLAEAEATAALSKYARQERAAAEAAVKGRELGARLLTAQALHYQGHALRSLGRQEEALVRLEEAERIYSAAGDRVAVARAAHDVANLLRDRGDAEGARQQYERALKVHGEAGNQRGIVLALTNLGGLELQKGDFVRAQQLLEQVVAICREIHDPLGEGRALSSLGSMLREKGDLQASQRSLEEALGRFRAIGNLLGEAGVRSNLAGVFLDLGKLREARTEAGTAVRLSRQIGHTRSLGSSLRQIGLVLVEDGQLDQAQAAFQEMEDLARRTGHKLILADARAGQGLVLHLQGRLPGAQQNARAALELWTEADDRQQAAAGQLVLARLALDEGRPAEADREARNAVERFRALRLSDGEALSREALAGILLASGEAAAADREIRRAVELMAPSQNRRVRLRVAITSGRVAAVLGQTAEARRTLTAAREEATHLGLRLSALDATLALAELELRRGNSSAGQLALQGLHDEANRQGFRLTALKAQELLQKAAVAQRR